MQYAGDFLIDLHDDVEDFTPELFAELVGWRDFYANHKVRLYIYFFGVYVIALVQMYSYKFILLFFAGLQASWKGVRQIL